MKTVFSNDRIAHLWFHQSQPSARNASGSHSFAGAHIRSYAAVIASVARTGNGATNHTAVFLTTRRYSVTTSHHLSYVRRAIPSGTPIFHVADPSDCVRSGGTINALDCIKAYSDSIDAAVETLARANKRGADKRLLELQALIQEANDCMAFIGRKRRFTLPSGYDIETARMAMARKGRAEEVARKKHLAEQEDLAALQRQEDWPLVERWRNGEAVRYPYSWVDVISLRIMPGLVRTGENEMTLTPGGTETVETSRGAEFPLSHCRRILDLVRSGTPYQSNGHSIHAGVFKVDAIDEQGNVTAGCHVVSREEIDRFACTLGWE